MKLVEVVLFASSFRQSGVRGGIEPPNISHALREDRSATICGRVGWVTEEGREPADRICCLRCARGLKPRPQGRTSGTREAPGPTIAAPEE